MAKNPPWTRDELILALDLYFRVGRKQVDPPHPEVITSGTLLSRFPIHEASSATADLRKRPLKNVYYTFICSRSLDKLLYENGGLPRLWSCPHRAFSQSKVIDVVYRDKRGAERNLWWTDYA